jgi:hypothetical protein
MGTTITPTTVLGPHVTGVRTKSAVYSLALPSSWTAAGVALDLSADFDYVREVRFGVSGAITDHGYKFCAFGTIVSGYGIAAAGVTIGAHYCDYDATADGAMIAVPNSTDLSAINDLLVTVVGE